MRESALAVCHEREIFMAWVELITILALLQAAFFAARVGKARGDYHIKAPAVAGHEMFERYYRVQMNTMEQLILFLPALWLGARHLDPRLAAAIGAIYLVGRIVYYRAYIADPAKRGMGFSLSLLPSAALLLAALVSIVRELLAG
jgi:glutathione S-transferase